MKPLNLFLAVLIVLSLAACTAQPATLTTGAPITVNTQPQPRSITVSGNAEVRVIPDEVILTLGIETFDLNLDIAKKSNDAIVLTALAVTKEFGIDPKLVQTEYISIEPRYDDYSVKRGFQGYNVRKTMVITLRDISKFEGLLSAMLKSGVNYIQGIDFRTTQLRKQRDQARSLAIKAAQEKAAALAGELGQKIGQPLTIHEDASNWWSGYSWWGSRWGSSMTQNVIQNSNQSTSLAEDSTLAPGQISVNATVTVEFELTR